MEIPDIQQIVKDTVAHTLTTIIDDETLRAFRAMVHPRVEYWKQRRGDMWAVQTTALPSATRDLIGYPEMGVKLFPSEEAARIEITRIKMLVPEIRILEKEQ